MICRLFEVDLFCIQMILIAGRYVWISLVIWISYWHKWINYNASTIIDSWLSTENSSAEVPPARRKNVATRITKEQALLKEKLLLMEALQHPSVQCNERVGSQCNDPLSAPRNRLICRESLQNPKERLEQLYQIWQCVKTLYPWWTSK